MTKLGQAAGHLPRLVPAEIAETLDQLHFEAPPMHYSLIREVVANEFGKEPEELFAHFEKEAFAAASVGQVHRARLRDGRVCAVKVQYPGIDGIVRADLRNLSFVLKVLAYLEPNFDFRIIAREALKYVPMELDFMHEADNCAAIRLTAGAAAGAVPPGLRL
jgi:predicted unusual protein kinase regulating ubiquinone biosynthesis (AarF/ABC1/UbiB family)